MTKLQSLESFTNRNYVIVLNVAIRRERERQTEREREREGVTKY